MNSFAQKSREVLDNAYNTAKSLLPESQEKNETLRPGAVDRDLSKLEARAKQNVLGAEVVSGAPRGEKPSETSILDKLTDTTSLTLGAAVAAGIVSATSDDKKTSEGMRNIGLGLAVAAAPSFLPEKYQFLGKMVSMAASAYLLGGKALSIAGHVIAHPIDSITKIFANPKEFLRDIGLATPEDAKKTEAEMKEGREKERAKSEKEKESPAVSAEQAEKNERAELQKMLALHASAPEAARILDMLSPTTLSMVLARYKNLVKTGDIQRKDSLTSVLEKIYDGIKADETEAIRAQMGFWEKGVGKITREVGSAGFSTIPIVGNIYSAGIAIAGYDPIAGESLSTTGRVIAGVTALIPFGGVIRGGARLAIAGGKVALRHGAKLAGRSAEALAPHLTKNPALRAGVSTISTAAREASERASDMAISAVDRARGVAAHPTTISLIDTTREVGGAIKKAKKAREMTRAFFGYDGMEEKLKNVEALNELGSILGKTEEDDEGLRAVNDNFTREVERISMQSETPAQAA